MTLKTPLKSIRNNRVLRRVIIPAKYHYASKLMAMSLSKPVGEIYDEAVRSLLLHIPTQPEFVVIGRKNNPPRISIWLDANLSYQAKELAKKLGITEHEVLVTAILAFGKKHQFDRVKDPLRI